MNPLWQNSKCPSGLWLHDFQANRYFEDGVEDVCTRCGQAEFFRSRDPNERFLSYHLRAILNHNYQEYYIEYPQSL